MCGVDSKQGYAVTVQWTVIIHVTITLFCLN